MRAKRVLFKILDEMPDGVTFTGGSIGYHVQTLTGEYHYPSSMLRYMRERTQRHRQIKSIHKGKSLYRMEGKQE